MSNEQPALTLSSEIVDSIETLGRRAWNAEGMDFPLTDDAGPVSVSARVIRSDERVEITDLEARDERPREHHGDAVLHDGPSFAAYVNRLATPATTMWACAVPGERTKPSIWAVFNDHTDGQVPGWRDHRARLDIAYDPDWRDWRNLDGKEVPQKDFAQFILDHAHTLGRQDVGKLLMAVQTFRATRNVKYSSEVNLTNGEVTFTFEETAKTDNHGQRTVKLPDKITVQSFVFAGATEDTQATEIEAWLRYTIPREAGEPLRLGYKLIRPDKAERDAWDVVCAQIDEATGDVPMLQGSAPGPLREGRKTLY